MICGIQVTVHLATVIYGRVAGPSLVMKSACNGCHTCQRNCPPQAIVILFLIVIIYYVNVMVLL